jgi:hypothetical protein
MDLTERHQFSFVEPLVLQERKWQQAPRLTPRFACDNAAKTLHGLNGLESLIPAPPKTVDIRITIQFDAPNAVCRISVPP